MDQKRVPLGFSLWLVASLFPQQLKIENTITNKKEKTFIGGMRVVVGVRRCKIIQATRSCYTKRQRFNESSRGKALFLVLQGYQIPSPIQYYGKTTVQKWSLYGYGLVRTRHGECEYFQRHGLCFTFCIASKLFYYMARLFWR